MTAMTLPRAASVTGRHRTALLAAVQKGRLPAQRVRRHYLVTADDLTAYILRNPSRGGVAREPVDSLMGLALAQAEDLGHRMCPPEADTERSRVASCFRCFGFAVADLDERPVIYGGAVRKHCQRVRA